MAAMNCQKLARPKIKHSMLLGFELFGKLPGSEGSVAEKYAKFHSLPFSNEIIILTLFSGFQCDL